MSQQISHIRPSEKAQDFSRVFSRVWRVPDRAALLSEYVAAIGHLFPGLPIWVWRKTEDGDYALQFVQPDDHPRNERKRPKDPSPAVKKAAETGQPVWLQFETQATFGIYWKPVMPNLQGEIVLPLTDEVMLDILLVSGAAISRTDFDFLWISATQFASHYRSLGYLKEKDDRLRELEILNRVTSFLNLSDSVDDFFENLYHEIKRFFVCDTYYLGTYNKDTQEITLELFIDEDFVSRKKTFPIQKLGFIRYVIEQKKMLFIKDFNKEIDHLPVRPVFYGKLKNSESWLGIPLLKNGEAVGIMAFASYRKGTFRETQLPILVALGQLVTSILSRIQMQENIRSAREKYESLFQSLTKGVALTDGNGNILEVNRALFRIFPAEKLRTGQPLEAVFSKRSHQIEFRKKLSLGRAFSANIQQRLSPDETLSIKYSGTPLLLKGSRHWLLWFDNQTGEVAREQLLLTLYQNSFRVQQAKTEKQIFRAAVSGLKQSGYHTLMLVLDPARQVFHVVAHSFSPEEFLAFPLVRKTLPRSIELGVDDFQALGQVLKTKEPVFREDVVEHLLENYPRHVFESVVPGFKKLHISRSLTIPILSGKKIVGAFVLFGDTIQPEDARIFQIFATSIAIALERTGIQREIEASEKKYRKTLEKVGTALFVTDCVGKIQSVNAAARKLLNRTVEELIDRPITSLVVEKEFLAAQLKKIGNRGLSMGDIHFLSQNNETIPAALSATAFRVQSEKIVEWIAWDLRPQKRREAEISRKNKELETLYRIAGQINRSRNLSDVYQNLVQEIVQLFQADSVGIYFIGADKKLHYRYGTGTTPEYIREVDLLNVGEGLAGWVAKYKKPLVVPDISKEPRLTRKIVLKSGFRSYAAVPIFAGKKAIGTLGLLTRTSRVFKRYEIKLLQTIASDLGIAFEKYNLTRQLEEASERYKHLFQEAFDGIVLLNLDNFHVVEINHSLIERLGLSDRGIENIYFPDLVVSKDRAKITSYLHTISGQNEMEILRLHMQKKGGGEFIADINGGALHFQNGRYGMLMIRDVTKQVELENRLRLSEQLAAVGELSAGIAHEIRNPLSAINTAVGLMKMNPEIPKEDSELLRIISEESKRLESVVSEFIQFARPQKPNFQWYPLEGLVYDSVRMFKETERSITFQLKAETHLGESYFDPYLIRQVLINLIKNAIESIQRAHKRKGKILVSLKKRLLNGRNYVQISVADNGIGISSEKIKSIFQPFFSTKESGLGMGLSISQKIIQQHNGFLTVESTVGKGSTFRFLLPQIKSPKDME
ncbi:MAG: GAF domain-containing protein [Calditrichaeota bacterium]|nr:GAF domain-containing protein [Calditrichota bacterium]